MPREHHEYELWKVTIRTPGYDNSGRPWTWFQHVAVSADQWNTPRAELTPYIVKAAVDIVCGEDCDYEVVAIEHVGSSVVFADVPLKALPAPAQA